MKKNRRYQGPVSERHKNRQLKEEIIEDLKSEEKPKLTFKKPQRGFHMDYKPKQDITTYELALCIPFIVSGFYDPALTEIEKPTTENYGRHFIITPHPKFKLPIK